MWEYYELIERISEEIYIDYQNHKKYEKMISLMRLIIKNAEPVVFHLHIDITGNNLL